MKYYTVNDLDNTLINAPNNDNLTVITYIDKSYYYFPLLLKSATKFGYPLKIIGWQIEWKGYCTRFRELYNLLLSYDSSFDNKYLLFVDGADVLFTDYYSKLIEKVYKTDYDVIISTSRCVPKYNQGTSCIILDAFTKTLFNAKDNNSIANAGLYIMKIKILKHTISKYINKINFEGLDDQRILNTELSNPQYNVFTDVDFKYGLISTGFAINQTAMLDDIKAKVLNPFIIHLFSQCPADRFIRYYFPDVSEDQINNMRPSNNMILKRAPYYVKLFAIATRYDIFALIISIIFAFIKS